MTAVSKRKSSKNLSRNWGWLLALGILFLILGCIGMGMVVGLTMLSMLFFAALLFIAGGAQIADVFKTQGWKGSLWHAFIAFLYIAFGAIIIYNPLVASAAITALLAWILIMIGVTRITMAFALRKAKGWGFMLVAGIASLILGILILIHWPWSGLWVIGLFIAIEMIVAGWSYIFIALGLRKKA